jgi:hypothetical protein
VVEFREGPVRVTRQGLLLPGERSVRHWETLRHVRESTPSSSEVPAPPVSDGVPIRQIVLGATPTVLGFDGGKLVQLQPLPDGRRAAFKLGQLCHWVLRQLSVTGRALDEIGLLPEASA